MDASARRVGATGGRDGTAEGLQDATYLRGVQVADASGVVRFTSIFPAWQQPMTCP